MERPEPNPAGMLGALRDLDAMARDASLALPGDLQHYLERRSYAKARMFMDGLGPIPAGACGRGDQL